MTASEHETTDRRQRRVRHGAGLLAGGAVVVAAAFAVPALARADDSTGASAETTSVTETVESTTTTTTPPTPPTTLDPVVQFAVTYDAWTQEEKNQFFFMTATPEELEAFVRYVTPPPPPPPPPPAPKKSTTTKSAAAAPSQEGHSGPGGYLACVRQRESGGRYNINTGNGYYGAYQFLPSTWNGIAKRAGRPDLVGVLPSNASPADQDAMAQALYAEQGRQPWKGNGC